jgi:hypothetical protein
LITIPLRGNLDGPPMSQKTDGVAIPEKRRRTVVDDSHRRG